MIAAASRCQSLATDKHTESTLATGRLGHVPQHVKDALLCTFSYSCVGFQRLGPLAFSRAPGQAYFILQVLGDTISYLRGTHTFFNLYVIYSTVLIRKTNSSHNQFLYFGTVFVSLCTSHTQQVKMEASHFNAFIKANSEVYLNF